MFATFVTLLLVAEVGSVLQANDLIVNTTIGQIRGVVSDVDSINGQVFQFLGVPYALPPVGPRRFMPSELMSWRSGVFNATAFGPICPQSSVFVNLIKYIIPTTSVAEDCLSLNVYVPNVPTPENSRFAVMVWFHGGALIVGSSTFTDPRILTSVGNVIVVTVNYRLGVLGFLTSEETSNVGNYGIWDQHLAIKWVKSNIGNFGGDPEMITIFGESSGSITASLQTLVPRNAGLFKHVICESGSALVPGGTVDNPRLWFKLFASKIGCDTKENTKPTDDILKCLKSKSWQEIIAIQSKIREESVEYIYHPSIGKVQWGPWVDGDLIPEEPAMIIQKMSTGHWNITIPLPDIDQIIGVNSQEGGLFLATQIHGDSGFLNQNATVGGLSENVYHEFMRMIVKSVTGNNQSAFADMYGAAIDHEYRRIYGPKPTATDRTIRYTHILSDLTFNMGVVSFARVHASFNSESLNKRPLHRTFMYLFDHRGSWKSHENWRTGADHTDDLDFVFGMPFLLGLGSTSAEKSLSSAMMTLWTNFAKTGDPNKPTPAQLPAVWPKFTVENEEYLLLRDDYTNEHPVGRQLYHSRLYFWTDYFPRLRAGAPKTCLPSE